MPFLNHQMLVVVFLATEKDCHSLLILVRAQNVVQNFK